MKPEDMRNAWLSEHVVWNSRCVFQKSEFYTTRAADFFRFLVLPFDSYPPLYNLNGHTSADGYLGGVIISNYLFR
jgi:hypothetical protein